MPGDLTRIITSDDPRVRDASLDAFCRGASIERLMAECDELDQFRRHSANLYERVRPELLKRSGADGAFPVLSENTPVRMDLTHSAWSDIFFLGMDFPQGARVLNVSIDLAVHGRDPAPRPPVEAYLRVIDEPVLRLTSVDLNTTADIRHLAEVFDFAKDYLGLL